jgi:hypothetical protein
LVLDLSQSTASVEGRVFGLDGKPMAGATIHTSRYHEWNGLSGSGGPNPSSPQTAADGRYKITGIGPGRWKVYPSHPHFQRGSPFQIVTLAPGKTVRQDLRVTEFNDTENAIARAAAEAERSDDLGKLDSCWCGVGGLPPVERNLATFGHLIFLSLAPGQIDSCYLDLKPLGLPRTAAPEQVARMAHAGELYFAPPDHLVTVNGTIVAPFTPVPKQQDWRVENMTRAQLAEQVAPNSPSRSKLRGVRARTRTAGASPSAKARSSSLSDPTVRGT